MPAHFAAATVLAALGIVLGASPMAAQGTRVVEHAGGFSYLPPPGWSVAFAPGGKYHLCQTGLAGHKASLLFLDVPASYPLKICFPPGTQLPHEVNNSGPFVTSSGLRGYRVSFESPVTKTNLISDVSHLSYVFPVKGRKIMAFATFSPMDASKYVSVADKAMKTFRLH